MMMRFVGLVLLFTTTLFAAPTPDKLRDAALGHIRAGTQKEGIAEFTKYLSKQLDAVSRIPSRELEPMAAAAECVRFMQLSLKAKPTDETAAWILASGARLDGVVNTIAPEDRLARVLAIMDRLRAHDPVGC